MTPVADNLARVRDEIAEACVGCGRDPATVRLVAVCKRIDLDLVAAAVRAGQRDLGENRIQDALPRQPELAARLADLPPDAQPRWHFIGHLQGNKARKATGAFELIHAVDSPKLARRVVAIAAETDIVQPVLAEVNAGGESQKNGLPLETAFDSLTEMAETLGPSLHGLMTMARFGADETELHRTFAALRELAERVRAATGLPLPELSMGMSGDFPIAIAEGATIVRVGTAIFGARAPLK